MRSTCGCTRPCGPLSNGRHRQRSRRRPDPHRGRPETQRWWTLTDPCQESLAERGSGHWWAPMQEIWHLDAPGLPDPAATAPESQADSRAAVDQGVHGPAQ
ncbi:L-rhamnose mutarotase [Lentzea alba]|uniref:L-rhamnose mutarotase n=1 Tax=Lentzea alba TaxID=2714351 RepID=UPI0028BDF6C2|nr:L-rhamnose mutarotase [Lentzea alba]